MKNLRSYLLEAWLVGLSSALPLEDPLEAAILSNCSAAAAEVGVGCGGWNSIICISIVLFATYIKVYQKLYFFLVLYSIMVILL